MNPQNLQPSIRHRPLFTRTVVIWTALGTLAATYLGILVLAPDWLDDLRPSQSNVQSQSNHGQRAAARLASDLSTLRDSVAQLQLDIAKVKTEVAGSHERFKSLSGQIAALEQKVIPATAQLGTETPAPPAKAAPEPAAPISTNAAAPATAAPKVINAAQSDNGTTGEIVEPQAAAQPAQAPAALAAAGIDFGAPVVKTAPKPVGIKLSSGASVDALRLSWSLLAETHPETLKNLQARYVQGGDPQNPNYELIAGPVTSAAAAKKICKALAANNVPCAPGAFTGTNL